MIDLTRRSFCTLAGAATAATPLSAAPIEETSALAGRIVWASSAYRLVNVAIDDGRLECLVKLEQNVDPLHAKLLLRFGHPIDVVFASHSSGTGAVRRAPSGLIVHGERLALDSSYLSVTSRDLDKAADWVLKRGSTRTALS